ncbi:MAG: hypothetical protein HQM05_11800 [Magnetococcales bacterium]|nr:hypothetical protein [Magnetococcales bacterium]
MGATWNVLHTRNLTELTLPGAHDAGTGNITSVLTPTEEKLTPLVTSMVNTFLLPLVKDDSKLVQSLSAAPIRLLTALGVQIADNIMPRLTQTQTMTIGEQLKKGCRYFDLRPAWTKDGYYLAHGEILKDLGFVGGIGERLESTLQDILAFATAAGHERELIILNFSHLMDLLRSKEERDNNALWGLDLIAMIRSILGQQMIVAEDAHIRVDTLPLQQLLADGRNVLCLFDPDNWKTRLQGESDRKQLSPQEGVFWCYPAEKSGVAVPCNFNLYDQYSNSRNQTFVIGTQKRRYHERMQQRIEHQLQEVFLLSWTITLPQAPSLLDMKSVLDHAEEMNGKLAPSMENWIKREVIIGKKRPNILYVDHYEQGILDVVTMINALPL